MNSTNHPVCRVGFAGTPAFAAAILTRLLASAFAPAVVYTQPDRPSGRGKRLQLSPVKALALEHGLEIHQPASLKSAAALDTLRGANLDVLVVAAYGLILPEAILATPRYGCLNVHASLLPRWRGAAPIERAIMAGDEETGVAIMQMDAGLDTGAVHQTEAVPITASTTGVALETTLALCGAELLIDVLETLPGREPTPQPQEGVTYAHKITRADTVIDWSADAAVIHRQVRALTGRLPAFTLLDDLRVQVLTASPTATTVNAANPGEILSATAAGLTVACGSGTLVLEEVRLNIGKGRAMSIRDVLSGYAERFAPGKVFHV